RLRKGESAHRRLRRRPSAPVTPPLPSTRFWPLRTPEPRRASRWFRRGLGQGALALLCILSSCAGRGHVAPEHGANVPESSGKPGATTTPGAALHEPPPAASPNEHGPLLPEVRRSELANGLTLSVLPRPSS